MSQNICAHRLLYVTSIQRKYMEPKDFIIVGGGLAGLTAAAILAKAGKKVVLIEQSVIVGGRAQTQEREGFLFNLGPHALYKSGAAARIYRELNLSLSGGEPSVSGGFLYVLEQLHPMPFSPWRLLSSQLFSWLEKWEAIQTFASMSKLNPQEQVGKTLAAWLTENTQSPKVMQFLQAVFRLTSYCADTDLLDAGLALKQFQLSMSGVQYIHGGWQTLVNELVRVARQAGAEILTGRAVKKVNRASAFQSVELEDSCQLSAAHLVLATNPETIGHLLDLEFHTVPIRAACLDVALRQLPMPNRLFVLGLDRPLYYSVHSAYSDLTPPGGALIHVARYLRHNEDLESAQIKAELEAFVDFLQPGWRQEVVRVRFMPQLVVAYDLPRPSTIESGIQNIHLAGDWVGQEGMLSDRAVASAAGVAQEILKADRP
jgi:protoporphyrinogen oxidase